MVVVGLLLEKVLFLGNNLYVLHVLVSSCLKKLCSSTSSKVQS